MPSDEELLQFLYGIPVGVCRFDANGLIDIANPRIAQIFIPIAGPTSVSSIDAFLRVVAPDLLELIKSHDGGPGLLVDGEEFRIEPEQMFVKGPGLKVISLTVTALTGGRFLASVTDVTTQRERELAQMKAEAKLRIVIDNIVDYAIFSTDKEGRIDTWNKSGERLFRQSEIETLGESLDLLVPLSAFQHMNLSAVLATGWEKGWTVLEGEIPRRDGSTFWAEGLVAPLLVEDTVAGYSVVVRDATEHRLAQEALEKVAHTDPLTGLYNRRAFFSRGLLRLALATSEPSSVLIVDIDNFKKVNDAYGHEAGDLVIREVARLFNEVVRSDDLVCRFGGEEFVILFVGVGASQATAIAERLRTRVQQTKIQASNGSALQVTISGGIEVLPLGRPLAPGALDAAIKVADERLYAAKRLGRNRIVNQLIQTV